MKQVVVAKVARANGKHWTAVLQGLGVPPLHGRSLAELRRRVKDTVHRSAQNPTHVTIVEELILPADLARAVAESRAERDAHERRALAIQQQLGRTVRQLRTRLKVGVRDAGAILGISAPYAHILSKAPRGRPRTAPRRRRRPPAAV